MVTPEGLDWIWAALPARLAGAVLRVSDGSQSAEATASEPTYVGLLEGQQVGGSETVTLVRISLAAEFGPQDANFEWRQTEIVVDGKVIDRNEDDLGRKAPGSSMTLETFFDLAVA